MKVHLRPKKELRTGEKAFLDFFFRVVWLVINIVKKLVCTTRSF